MFYCRCTRKMSALSWTPYEKKLTGKTVNQKMCFCTKESVLESSYCPLGLCFEENFQVSYTKNSFPHSYRN